MGKGQSLLFDLLIAFGLFSVGLVLILFFVGDSFGLFGIDRLDSDADFIVRSISEGSGGGASFSSPIFDSRGAINESSFFDLLNFSYDDLKRELDVSSDFCIYVANDDGVLVSVYDVDDNTRVDSSVGYNLNGAKCGN